MAKRTEKQRVAPPSHLLPCGPGDQESFLPGFSAIPAVKGWLGLSIEAASGVPAMDPTAWIPWVGRNRRAQMCETCTFSKKEKGGQLDLGVGLQRKG